MQGEEVPFMLELSASDFDIRLPELTTPHQKEKIHPPREGDGAAIRCAMRRHNGKGILCNYFQRRKEKQKARKSIMQVHHVHLYASPLQGRRYYVQCTEE
ncbi:hypothetical protein TEQG_02625 [Trichophyton equinum CBS 127.97]|uniref:Uncharacterized protein n=1 Tax=Trichophyton equinum (strain ATCC MYA-4606 / CBS 127.97) TaxID=559882 RepID=F2PNX7_TRIEC|nr:hypothetical protein TEQG_02625 [Trichophyton equinum CBS 127.97]